MSLFKSYTTEGMEEAQDRTGGGFQALESDIYIATIKALYAGESSGGAKYLNLIAEIDGREYRETLYFTSGTAKGGHNWSINQKTGKKYPLPGFVVVNDLCLITTGEELHEQDKHVEKKTLNLYNFDEKKEIPTAVQMVTSVLGKQVALGIRKELGNKREQVGSEWVDSAETRESNVIDKVFHPELKLTVVEARKGAKTVEEALFWDTWLGQNHGKTQDKRSIKDGEAAPAGASKGSNSAPPKAGQTSAAAPRKSLFG